ncbi:MAG TPA: CPBP family intramembrane glutamic endopeptidase, partial [Chitinophagaceae bacterium]|nr:CPBP family intramembrane glutamic endopeptidase [Chitinophagaceae bacterium]
CYLLMLVAVVAARKMNTGTTSSSKKFQLADLDVLNYLHLALMSLVLAATFMLKPLPYFLMEFPDRISFGQLGAFLLTFGAISFIPWKKFNQGVQADADFSQVATFPVGRYAFLRAAFLVMYEWFFRGLLLMSFSAWLGVNWGVAINVILYVVLHAHKNKKEMLGCVPFGLVLCVFTIWWQSIWPAIIFHVQLAALNEWPLLQKFISLEKQNAL